jgi:glycosyltransferase involved in cell wall biosynthesis
MYSSNLETLLKSLQGPQEHVVPPVQTQEPVVPPVQSQEPPALSGALRSLLRIIEPANIELSNNLINTGEPVTEQNSRVANSVVQSSQVVDPVIHEELLPISGIIPLVKQDIETATRWTGKFTGKAAKRILLISTHCHQYTGYSKVSWNLLKTLARFPEFALFHYGIQKFSDEPASWRPYPDNVAHVSAVDLEKTSGVNQSGFGFTPLVDYLNRVEPHIVIIYNDAFIISKYIEVINRCKKEIRKELKVCAYIDQTYLSQRAEHITTMNQHIDQFFVFNSFWAETLKLQGITKPINIYQHGFDPTLHPQMERRHVRKTLNIPMNAFVIASLNRNCPRKRYDILIAAFADLVCRHPERELRLFCVCDRGDHGGYTLIDIYVRELKRHNVPVERHMNKILLVNKFGVHNDHTINLFYNCADIGVSTADGEGFGLCHFEMMGLGKPQVLPSHGAFSSYADHSNTEIVPTKHNYYVSNTLSPVAGEACAVEAKDVSIAMEKYLMDSNLVKSHGVAARRTVLKSDWLTVSREFIQRLRVL